MHWLRLAKPGEELGKELGTSSRQMTAGWTDANNARNCAARGYLLPIVAAAGAEKGRGVGLGGRCREERHTFKPMGMTPPAARQTRSNAHEHDVLITTGCGWKSQMADRKRGDGQWGAGKLQTLAARQAPGGRAMRCRGTNGRASWCHCHCHCQHPACASCFSRLTPSQPLADSRVLDARNQEFKMR